ncbi:MAG TPA: hypothetical protein VF950_18170 [Planctomycetota bacterium]
MTFAAAVILLATAAPSSQDKSFGSLLAVVAQDKSREIPTSRRLVEVPVDKAKLSGRPAAELWVSADRGRTWSNQGPLDLGKATAGFLAPSDGAFGFLVVPVGADGAREFTPKPGDLPAHAVVVDTAAPAVEVLAPNGGEVFGAKRTTVVKWAAQDLNLAPGGVSIELSAGGTEDWVPVAKDLPNSGTYHWDIGAASGESFKVRVLVRDLAGNTGMDASDRPFSIDGLAPDLRVTGPAAATAVPVAIEYSAVDLGGAGLRKAVLWVTKDGGQTWAAHGEDEDLRSPIPFQDLDGVYGLRMSGEDRVGNAVPEPRPGTPPQATLRLDRTRPEVKLLSPAAAGYLGGVPIEVRWSAKDNLDTPANPVAIAFSEDAGKTWKDVAAGLKNDGLHAWTPPKTAAGDCRIRVAVTDLAGNVGEAVSGRFGLDGSIPEARATGPDRAKTHQVDVGYVIRELGTAPVSVVTLWYKPDGAKEWTKYADDADAVSPILFAKADGKYGLYVTCGTEQAIKAGVAQKPPAADAEAQLVLTIDATPPLITLESFTGGGYYKAADSVEVLWKMVEPHPDPRGLQIHHSADGGATWNLAATQVDPTPGKHRWVVPPTPGARHKLRLSVTDSFGNRAEATSDKPFTIDDDLPTVIVSDKPAPTGRSNRIAVKYKAYDPSSGIDRVQLHGRLIGTDRPLYRLLTENRAGEGTLEAELPQEGTWALVVTAVDGAGNMSAQVERSPKPDFSVTVDLVKPQIAIKDSALPTGARTYVNPSWEVEWRASDNATPSDRMFIRVESSQDGGKTWHVAIQSHPNTGKADLRAYLLPGKRYRLRLIATDQAGNEGEALTPDFDPGEIPPPNVILRGIDEGRQYPLSTQVTAIWTTSDKTIREAVLELSVDGGRTWTTMARMSTPSMRVSLPAKEGRYHVRAVARDAVNRPLSSQFVMFDMIAGLEPVRIVTHATVPPGKSVPVVVEPKHILRMSKDLRLETSTDGQEWRKVADVRDSAPTFQSPTQPGEYWLRLVVNMPDGKEYDSNHVRFTVAGGGIKLMTFRGGETYEGLTNRIIHVKTDADLAQVRVEISTESGKDGTWKDVQRGDLKVETAGLFWRLPERGGDRCRLRVSVKDVQNKTHSDESEKDFTIRPPSGQGPSVVAPRAVTPPPEGVRVEASLPAVVKGGTTHAVRWAAADEKAKVKLLLVSPDTSEVIAESLSSAGTYTWTAPRKDLKGCRLRVESGGSSDHSTPFELDSTPPSVDGVDIEVSK